MERWRDGCDVLGIFPRPSRASLWAIEGQTRSAQASPHRAKTTPRTTRCMSAVGDSRLVRGDELGKPKLTNGGELPYPPRITNQRSRDIHRSEFISRHEGLV
jgi:hypothetical protein